MTRLQANKTRWARLELADKIALLKRLRTRVRDLAPGWVKAAAEAKGLNPDAPSVGEEWMSGPWALMLGIKGYLRTLQSLAAGEPVIERGKLRTRNDGRVVVDVFPVSRYDRLLRGGVRAEVWMQPEVTLENFDDHVTKFYQLDAPEGAVALVLGAGNISSIPPLDCLYKLIAEGRVALLKLNPVNTYLEAHFSRLFAPLIEEGYLELTSGDAEVGQYLTGHDGIEEIHITGSAKTHDAIVFGSGEEGKKRKAENRPLLAKPISSELGNVSPTIVVPGPWTEADYRYQAELIATQKFHNDGFNCIAAQVLLTSADWAGGDKLLEALRKVVSELSPRPAYYPGAAERHAAVLKARPQAERLGSGEVPYTLVTRLDPDASPDYLQEEIFAPVLFHVALPGRGGDYLKRAVAFCNQRLAGTLGANLLIHPESKDELATELDEALAALRYGVIAVNTWTGEAYSTLEIPWGAHPGHRLNDIGSGLGVVHNTFLLDKPEKTVLTGNFQPFPRGLARGVRSMGPKPPWYVTHRGSAEVGRRLIDLEADEKPRHLPGIFWHALTRV